MDRMIIMSPVVRIQTTYYTLGTANTLLIDNERRLSSLSRKRKRNGKKKTPFIASTFSFYPLGFLILGGGSGSRSWLFPCLGRLAWPWYNERTPHACV